MAAAAVRLGTGTGRGGFLPVAWFLVPIGLGSLAAAWHSANDVLGLPAAVGDGLAAAALALLVLAAAGTATGMVRAHAAVRQTLSHPVLGCFLPAIGIALMQAAGIILPQSHDAAEVLWLLGSGVNLVFGGFLYRLWLSKPGGIERLHPGWLIPALGNMVSPVVGARLGYFELSWFFLAGGIGLWLVVAPALFQRLVFRRGLPESMFPTVFLILAPPAAAALAICALGGTMAEPVARLLMFVSLFLALGLLTLVPRFLRAPFSLAWWCCSFPAAELASAALLYHDARHTAASHALAVLLLLAASALTLVVAVATLRALVTGGGDAADGLTSPAVRPPAVRSPAVRSPVVRPSAVRPLAD
jgi:tellurite resistance protein